MRLVSLASGSLGNAYCVELDGDILLIDCGISVRELRAKMALCGLDAERIVGTIVTHNHIDHIRGLKTFRKYFPKAELYSNFMTAESSAALLKMKMDDFAMFENGQPFEVGPFFVQAFSIPHDVPDPVGFIVKTKDGTYFHSTDIGTPMDSIGVHLAEADYATLESNHDPVLLYKSNRRECLKQRIRGPRGHLSNEQAAELVRKFASPRLKELRLAHLSRECNEPHIAEEVMRKTLREMNREDIVLKILTQDDVIE